MYIELFILDNFIMDALLLRLAYAFCAAPVRGKRVLLFSFFGAALAVLSLVFPLLTTLPGRLATALVMAFALPVGRVSAYLRALGAVLAAALLTGGLALVFATLDGGGLMGGGITGAWRLRTALLLAAAAAVAPFLLRRFRHGANSHTVKVYLVARGEELRLRGLWDTGAHIHEPVSGLPVIAAYAPSLLCGAEIPVPTATVTGETMLYALRPDVLIIDGRPSDALVAPLGKKLRGAEAIIPTGIFGEAR